MVSKTVWYLSAVVITLYALMPAFWMYSLIGMELPAGTGTLEAAAMVAVGCLIMTAMGYSLGRAYPEDLVSTDEWYASRRKDKE